MKRNKGFIRILGNITLALAIGLSIYLLVNMYILRSSLPPGVCPVEQNRSLIYVAIVLALSSFVLSVIESRFKRGQ